MEAFKKFQRILIVFFFVVSAFYSGYYFGKKGYIVEIRKNPPQVEIINRTPPTDDINFSRFWEVWGLVSKEYLLRPVDTQKMYWGAIRGMVDSLGDPYTSFLPPEVNEAVNSALNGRYQGIGAELGIRESQLIVVAPLDGSPAKAAGVRAGDKITEIEGESTLGITLNEAVAKIRGDAGTISTLTLQRENDEPFVVYIKRGVITIESVSWEDKGEGTAYIRVSRFGDETVRDWKQVVKEVNVGMNELDAVIVDLRGNPGGYMNGAVDLADEFVEKDKVVLYQESALGEKTAFKTAISGIFETIPGVIVLIDEGSASASEILAAALRAHVDATLVGTKSFGKGTIQAAEEFDDGSGLHITVAKWLTPSEEWINDIGLEPNVVVEITSEDIESGNDPQLDKALEIARGY